MGNHDDGPSTRERQKGESSRQDTCIMERENDAKLSESIYEKYQIIRAVVPIGLEVKHCNMLIWKWDLRRGKRRGGGSTILFPMQMIYDELPSW